jgi:apolipoprotein N-acyltransferase
MSPTPASKVNKTASNKKIWSFIIGVLLSCLSGIMMLLAFPPYGLWPLMWVAFIPFIFAQYRLMPSKWSSLAVALSLLFWLGPFLARLFGTEIGFFFTGLGVWIAILNLFIAKERGFHELTRNKWFVLASSMAFVGFEMVRATLIPLVATSAFVGYTQATQAWLIQPVSVFSVYGLDLVILLVNYSLALAIIAWYDTRRPNADPEPVDTKLSRRWLILSGGLLVAWVGLSLIMFNQPKDGTTVKVAALRPGFELPAFQDEVNTPADRLAVFSEQVHEAADQGAQILYTPEMLFNFDPQQEYTEELQALAQETNTYIFITYTVSKEGQAWRNEAVLLTPDGNFTEVYGKNHAFGEPPTAMNGVYPVFTTPLGRLATLICHDANYTDVARKLSANGAQIIAAPINEFGGFGDQYWTNALFRAVENQTAVVVSGRAHVSAIINADGSISALDLSSSGSRNVLVAEVTLGSGRTIYNIIGDVLGWLCMAGFVFFIFYPMVVERKAKKAKQINTETMDNLERP